MIFELFAKIVLAGNSNLNDRVLRKLYSYVLLAVHGALCITRFQIAIYRAVSTIFEAEN